MCNDNLSGVAMATALACILARTSHRYSYRFLFVPGTIGPIAWLSRIKTKSAASSTVWSSPASAIAEASTTSAAGVSPPISTGPSSMCCARGELPSSSAISRPKAMTKDNSARGFDLPVGSFRRTPHGEYPEYHTSADNLSFVSPAHLADSLGTLLEVIDLLESDIKFVNLSPMGEPQLGKRGLLPAASDKEQMALLWLLNLRRRKQRSRCRRALGIILRGTSPGDRDARKLRPAARVDGGRCVEPFTRSAQSQSF
jgi:hypothetical protein